MILAGNRVFSHIIEEDHLFAYKLRTIGYETFENLFNESSENNLFKTPVDFNTSSPGPGYQYNADVGNEFKLYITSLLNSQFNSDLEIKEVWFLHQTNDSWVDNPIHMHMTAEWIAVTYLDVKVGDAIEFYDGGGNMERYEPQFGEILFFHGSALHKPSPNVSSKRLSLNMELGRKAFTEDEKTTISTRLAICNSCDRLNREDMKCSECSCYMPMKVTMFDYNCPLGKW